MLLLLRIVRIPVRILLFTGVRLSNRTGEAGIKWNQPHINVGTLSAAWRAFQPRHPRESQKPKRLCDHYQIQLLGSEKIRSLVFRVRFNKRTKSLRALQTEGEEGGISVPPQLIPVITNGDVRYNLTLSWALYLIMHLGSPVRGPGRSHPWWRWRRWRTCANSN